MHRKVPPPPSPCISFHQAFLKRGSQKYSPSIFSFSLPLCLGFLFLLFCLSIVFVLFVVSFFRVVASVVLLVLDFSQNYDGSIHPVFLSLLNE